MLGDLQGQLWVRVERAMKSDSLCYPQHVLAIYTILPDTPPTPEFLLDRATGQT